MYSQPASAANTACSNVNRVVAIVLIPMLSSFWQACRPSHVETTLMISLEGSKLESSFWTSFAIPMLSATRCSPVVCIAGISTLPVANKFSYRALIYRVGHYVDGSCQERCHG